jgi:type III secretion protein L
VNNKKFFTLIRGDTIHVAPQSKIIPADVFSTLQTAEEVLEQIKKDAEKYRLDVSKECEHIKEVAFKEGYEEGLKQWTEHLIALEKEIELVHKELQHLVIPVALKAAKKIVGREIETSSDVIVDIVAANLKAVASHKKVIIYVNKKDFSALDQQKNRIKGFFEELESLTIRERADVQPGGCIIETEGGIINAQLENRWRVLEKAFEALAQSRSSPKES